jgi:hypothetical protein
MQGRKIHLSKQLLGSMKVQTLAESNQDLPARTFPDPRALDNAVLNTPEELGE